MVAASLVVPEGVTIVADLVVVAAFSIVVVRAAVVVVSVLVLAIVLLLVLSVVELSVAASLLDDEEEPFPSLGEEKLSLLLFEVDDELSDLDDPLLPVLDDELSEDLELESLEPLPVGGIS